MEDHEIVQLFWDRDVKAIRETEKKYGNYCTSIARNILGNEEDAKECVNDTYMNAWNCIPPNRPAVLSAFLGKITRNLSYSRYRYESASKRGRNAISEVFEELSECVSGKDSVEQEVEYKELVKVIDSFWDTLSPKKRSIFVCRYWYADCISDIAKQFHMRENTVSMTLHRIRWKLQTFLTERGYEI